jgi:hypothetical protein
MTVKSTTVTGDFAVAGGCKAKVAAGGSCPLELTFTPTAAGTRTGTLTIVDTDPSSPQVVNLTGEATNIFLSNTPVVFGGRIAKGPEAGFPNPQNLGSTVTANVTLTNQGTTPLTITSIAIGGANASQYTQTNTCLTTIAPGGKCGIVPVFKPTISGLVPAPLTITSNDPQSPQILYLQGRGTQISVPSAVTIPNTTLGSTTQQAVTVKNVGNTTVTFGGFSITCYNAVAGICAYYTQTNNCGASLGGKKSCTVTVSFAPTVAGSSAGTLSVMDNDKTSPQTVTVTGIGVSGANHEGPEHP